MPNNPTSTLKKLLIICACFTLALTACKKDNNEDTPAEVIFRPVTPQSSAYVTQLLAYMPAPGQFINTTSGNNDAAKTVLNGKTGLVSLGAFGGTIILGFDHTVTDQNGKEDIIIYNNASTGYAEPGVVWVMQDANGNGKADEAWYELAGSAKGLAGYVRNYSITYTRPATNSSDVSWTDNKGGSGVVKTNTFHTQAYYPLWVSASTLTLTGTLLPSTNINDTNPTFITSNAFAYGYADNTPGGDKLDIANAIDENGNKISLKGVDFIKIQTGIAYNLGWLGELSTDIKGVADMSIEKL